MTTQTPRRVLLVSVMGLLLTASILGLTLGGILTQVVPAAACWAAVVQVGFRRRDVLVAAVAVRSCAAGNTHHVLASPGIRLCRVRRRRTFDADRAFVFRMAATPAPRGWSLPSLRWHTASACAW